MHASFYSNYLVSGQELLKAMRHDNKLSILKDLNITLGKPSTNSLSFFCNSFSFSLTLNLTQMTSHESSEGGNAHSHTDGLAREGFPRDRKSTRLNSSHITRSRMPSSA